MPTAASIMVSSQLPLLLRAADDLGQVHGAQHGREPAGVRPAELYVYLMISAARGQTDRPSRSAAARCCWCGPVIVADQASISWIDFCAYALSPVMYQASASVYAAIASSRSSVQPLLGLEYEPHSTIARGLGVRDSEAYGLAIIWSYAAVHGCAPASTLALTKSSWARPTRTPGWTNVACTVVNALAYVIPAAVIPSAATATTSVRK